MLPLWLVIQLALPDTLSGQEIVFREDFSGYADGTTEGAQATGYWRSTPFDCDDGGSINVPGPLGNRWGVFDSVFVASDVEGACCSNGTSGNNRSFVAFTIDISAYCAVDFSLLLYGSGGLECDPAALEPDFNCSTIPLHDQAVVEYAAGQDTIRAAYICGSEGTGSVRVNGISGDSLRLFVYLSTSEDNEFYALDNLVVTGYLPPDIETPAPVQSCSAYVLPPISGTHLSGNQAYYTEPNGQGTAFSPGTPFTVSDTLYLYDQVGNCSDQDTLVLVFEPVTRFDAPGDQAACRQYVLPPITGVELSGREAYYTGPAGSGERLIPGAILDSSQFIYIHDDGSNCQEEVRFFVSINNPPTVRYETTAPGCYDGADGSIQLQITGMAPFLIDWSVDSLDGKSTVSGLQAGSYAVTVMDSNQCDTSLTITLLQPTPLALNCSVLRPALTPTGNEGIAEITFSEGTAPYQVEWSGPVNGTETGLQEGVLQITGLERGEYTVRLTDRQGCVSTCSFSVSGPPCDLVLQVDEQPPTCHNSSDGAIFTKVSTSRPPVQIDWDDDRWDTEDTLRNLPAGLYNVTVTDQLGCVISADIELTQPDSITLICRATRPVSTVGGRDGRANILLAGGARPYRLVWSGPVTDSLQVPRAAELDLEELPAGEYTLVVTDAKGCSTQCSFTIKEPACNLLLFLFQQSPVDCYGEATAAINLGANNGRRPYAYEWSGPATIGNLEDPVNIPAGNYAVTVTDAIGCQDSASIIIDQPPPLAINCAQLDPVSLPGESDGIATLRAEGGAGPYDFVWTGPTLGGELCPFGSRHGSVGQFERWHLLRDGYRRVGMRTGLQF